MTTALRDQMRIKKTDQTSYRLVIDAGHNEGTSLREDAGYDEKC